ncbi:olfactory receptor 52P1 isoform X1 [Pituophis catenifer annectens]|uniref:olfactory receptor 52P1 isoform X1 n=1 Tax=Pituophis catenifer annectens TaxID=94852 RepID=UPI00399118C5
MFALNGSHGTPSSFILLGIPGLEALYHWISIPLSSMYVVTLLGNSTMLYVITTEQRLHKPMYLFLCMLATIDLVLSTSTLPKMLCIVWFRAGEISSTACLAQMFFIHAFSVMESSVLVAMAFDRFVAICNPLRYDSILTTPLLTKIGIVVVLRGTVFIAPIPFLAARLSYCKTNIIAHTYCEHMAVVKLACSSILPNVVYGLLVALLVVGADLLFITFSYCMITRAVLALPSRDARYKAFSTCAAHVVVILVSYTPALFTILTHRFGHHVLPHVHILLANFYLLFPPMLNPIVYGVKTKEIRDQVKRVLLGDAGKEKLPRYYKNIGLGFKTPKEAIEGSYIDKKCPFTGNVSIRGRILSGVVTKMKMQRTIVIRRDYLHYIRKYNRFEKRHKNMSVHLSPCFRDVQIGDIVTVGECRPLSKTVRFNVLKVTKAAGTKKQFQKF